MKSGAIFSRRDINKITAVCAALCGTAWKATAIARPAMARVVLDNDYSGDPDGLVQLAHHLLSPSLDIAMIVGSHLPDHVDHNGSTTTATDSAVKTRELLEIMGMGSRHKVYTGSERAIRARNDWSPSPATAAIVAEAMCSDCSSPFVYAAGAGLTELALAYLTEPRIGPRTRLIWIGGYGHTNSAHPPHEMNEPEFNFSVDPLAAQIIFNESDIEIWQVPRDSYRQMLYSYAELRALGRSGRLGRYLEQEIMRIDELVANPMTRLPFPRTETYAMGDNPLVTLTALQSFFSPDPSSSFYREMPTPHLGDNGEYTANPDGRPMRVYTQIDTRLTFADLEHKIREFDARQE